MNPMSKMLIIGGIVLIVFGSALAGKLGPLGKLLGDIAIQRSNFSFYFPIATSIILSIILSIIFWLFRK